MLGSDAKASEQKRAELVPPLGTSLSGMVLTLQVGAKFAGSTISTQGGVFVFSVKPAEGLSFTSNIEAELISKHAGFSQHFVFSSLLHASLWSFSKYTGFSLATLVRLKCPPPAFFLFFNQACDTKIRETSCLNQQFYL